MSIFVIIQLLIPYIFYMLIAYIYIYIYFERTLQTARDKTWSTLTENHVIFRYMSGSKTIYSSREEQMKGGRENKPMQNIWWHIHALHKQSSISCHCNGSFYLYGLT